MLGQKFKYIIWIFKVFFSVTKAEIEMLNVLEQCFSNCPVHKNNLGILL